MVKQMKHIILILLYFLISNNGSQATSDLPRELGAARLMTGLLSNNVLLGGKEIPEGWGELMQIDYMKREATPSASYFKAINSFALVPHAPLVKKQKEISTEYSGARLFLISRYKIYTNARAPGRCVILIFPSVDKFEKNTIAAYFIPETTAQLILAQIPDFDPTAQPLAFDDDFLVANQKRFQGEDLDSTILEIEKSRAAKKPSGIVKTGLNQEIDRDLIQKKIQRKQAEWQNNIFLRNLTPWSVTGFITLVCAIVWYLRHRRVSQAT
jgi:hypothetical protein